MGGARALLAMSFHASVRRCFQTRLFSSHMDISRLTTCVSIAYDKSAPRRQTANCLPLQHMWELKDKITTSSFIDIRSGKCGPSIYSSTLMGGNKLLKNMLGSQVLLTSSCSSSTFHPRSYSSRANGTKDTPEISTTGDKISESSNGESTSLLGKDLLDAFEHARQSVLDGATSIADKTKHLSDKVTPHLQQLYESHPYLEKVIVPVGGTFSATILAWFFMPKIFRKLHKYTSLGPVALFQGNSNTEASSYEKSMWGALEDPARYLVTFLAFSQLGLIIAPTTGLYFPHVWRGAVVLSFIWFLHRWKTNFFSISLASNQVNVGLDREKLMALEKLSSVGLLVLGVMGLAEVVGVPVQSIITVGGVGGVATAFAARDILGNLFSGLSLQFSKPFVVGDTIKAGSVEGQVTEMGLTATSLINPEEFPVIVPNSLFSSQVIVNKSRAQWRASMNKIPIQVNDIEKVPLISQEIKSMLQAHSKVFLGKDAPFCYLSRVERTFAELTFGCNLKSMRKDELLESEQDILLQAMRIIQQHGAELGSYQTT